MATIVDAATGAPFHGPPVETGTRQRARRDPWLAALFTVTAMLGASLLFAVEPLVAKLLLPDYGGSATVWSTSSLFFQIVLLLAYLYAHWSTRLLGSALAATGSLPRPLRSPRCPSAGPAWACRAG